MSDRGAILDTARKLTCGDRDKDYGSPVRNMDDIARVWAEYLRTRHDVHLPLVGEDVAWMMVMLKACRSVASYKEDNYTDAAAYAAIAGECAGVDDAIAAGTRAAEAGIK